jgi:hypothetical protein
LNHYAEDVEIEGESHWVPDYVLHMAEELPFADPVWKTIRHSVEQAVEEERATLDLGPFLTHSDKEVRNRTAELLAQTDSLSPNWEKRLEGPPPKLDEKLGEVIQSALYHFQIKAIDVLFQQVKAQFAQLDPTNTEQLRNAQTKLHNVKQLERKLCLERGTVIRPLTPEEQAANN